MRHYCLKSYIIAANINRVEKTMLFSSLDLANDLQKGLTACDHLHMTPIQQKAIIPARQGRDILACAQTGTGKTAAFAVPILQRLSESVVDKNRQPTVLILTPTRELAEQLATTISAYAQFLPITTCAVYGGVKTAGQANKLRAGVDILIATPGRLLELIQQCHVNLSAVNTAVLDEADRMLDMGFVADVQQILQQTAKQRQTLLFSATLSGPVNQLAHKVLNNHLDIRISKDNVTADTVEHVMYAVEERRKIELFWELLHEYNWFQVLVFTSTKKQADALMAMLKDNDIDTALCHGDKSQGARRRALADFKSAKVQVLVATEVAARGIDIQGLEYVVNFNLPYLAEDYVHRIGRTGRAGAKGHAISFVSREEERNLASIERLIGSKIKRIKKSGFEVSDRDKLIASAAKRSRRRSNKQTKTQFKQTTDQKKKSGKKR